MRRRIFNTIGLALQVFLILGCATIEPVQAAVNTKSTYRFRHSTPPPVSRTVDEISAEVRNMPLAEKVGQLFIIDWNVRSLSGVRTRTDAVQNLNIGGFMVRNTDNITELTKEIHRLQRLSRNKLFIAADFERGVGRRENGSNPFTEFPSNMAVGASRDYRLAEEMGRITAVESKQIGVNLLFAPVSDVNNNPENPIINTRSFGEDPQLVADFVEAFVRGAEREGVFTTLKHFPGHGNTSVDSHSKLGVVSGDRNALLNTELFPFRQVLQSATPPSCVMTAHLSVPAFEDAYNQNIPATFNSNILQDLLRTQWNYQGLVITDGINMGAITENYPAYSEAIVEPIRAGADIVLLPTNPKRAIDAVIAAVQQGRLSIDRIDASVTRILNAKARVSGTPSAVRTINVPAPATPSNARRTDARTIDNVDELQTATPSTEATTVRFAPSEMGYATARSISEKSLTLLNNEAVLPLGGAQKLTLVQMSYSNSTSIAAAMNEFGQTLDHALSVESFKITGTVTQSRNTAILNAVGSSDTVVLAFYLRASQGRGNVSLNTDQAALARQIAASGKQVVVVTFGNPYIIENFPNAQATLVAYDQSLLSANAAARSLLGQIIPQGKLPVSVGTYSVGSNIYSTPAVIERPSNDF